MTLTELNELPADQAHAEFLKCCGSRAWARKMVEARPFVNVELLLAKADGICRALTETDWLEAFRAHPKIGERKAAVVQPQQARNWSAQEQSGVASASAQTIDELARLNREYEARFGFIFIVCASGKSSEEMLSILELRIDNDPETEICVAAEEQRKITRLRLEILLSQ